MAEQIKLTVPINQLEDRVCSCGGQLFTPALRLKIIPPLYSQSGKYDHLMMQVGFYCIKCQSVIPLVPQEDDTKEERRIIDIPGNN